MLHIVALITLAVGARAHYDEDVNCKFYTTDYETEFRPYFNSLNYTFKIAHQRRDYSLMDTIFATNNFSLETSDYQVHGPEIIRKLPKNFDARNKWPNCSSIRKIHYQGQCGSCWTFGTANTASDRTCIHKHISVDLSEQDLKCCKHCYRTKVCNGGIPAKAFNFWLTDGLVTTSCKPYDLKVCDLFNDKECYHKCVDGSIDYHEDKHFANRVYRVPANVDQIKAELFINGPIEASFTVYRDLTLYESGIYEHVFGDVAGGHSVRIIGYGTDQGVDYWLVANSWGTGWGENGLFRIQQRTESFENTLCTGLPKN